MRTVGLAVAALTATAALAQTGGVTIIAPPAAAVIGLRELTFAELTVCAQQLLDRTRDEAALGALRAQLNPIGRRLQGEAAAIDASRSKVNLRDAKSVAAFNARIARFHADTASYAAETARLQRRIEALNSATAGYNIQCAQRPFAQADIARLPPPLRAVEQAHSTTMARPTVVGTQETPVAPVPGPAVVELPPVVSETAAPH